ncbi:hypothetical protein BC343_20755 [Mucilaginibacter pedocola]|uniref:Uncharacterized protein n=1 Tax=Mucilaginibacter pedocola TaxID=1792845 RepID=A0A1S9PKE4_9SPHI|nr:hypothetical protein BC343_20755 [Mucilaginibacter pedocola]
MFFKAPKVYDLNEIKHIRAEEEPSLNSGFGRAGNNRQSISKFDTGTIKFDYGLKTVKFGNDLDEAEARYIIERLKSRKMLTEKNF